MGAYTFELDNIINKGMLPVVRKRDILRARVLTREEKKEIPRGGPDILVISPSGQRTMLHRADIIQNYTYLDGKKISMAGWSSSKEYIIAKEDNTDAMAMMVPTNCTADINGEIANSAKRSIGDYVVGLVGETGGVDNTTVGIIPAAMFKKMYYMPPNDVISRNLNKGNKTYEPDRDSKQGQVHKDKFKRNKKKIRFSKEPEEIKADQIDYSSELGFETKSFDFGQEEIYNYTGKPVENTQQKKINTSQDTEYKYSATGRLVNIEGSIVGFVIQNKEGNTKNITKGQMMELCKKKLVSNIMLGVRNDSGKYYLRGNNIRIEALPEYPSSF